MGVRRREISFVVKRERAQIHSYCLLYTSASIQLIPTTAAMLRLRHGAESPFDILPAVLIVSLVSCVSALFTARLAAKTTIRWKRRQRL